MKLKWFRVREFQSIIDSNRIEVDDITCLVGKNEAGKSALLRALYRLNPIVDTDSRFNVTHDYPCMDVEDYRFAIETGQCRHAIPIQACYSLDEDELTEIEDIFGKDCITDPEIIFSKNYANEVTFSLSVNDHNALEYLIDKADFSEQTRGAIKSTERIADALITALQEQEQTEEVKRISLILSKIKTLNVEGFIHDTRGLPMIGTVRPVHAKP